jgi:hypothetical protein
MASLSASIPCLLGNRRYTSSCASSHNISFHPAILRCTISKRTYKLAYCSISFFHKGHKCLLANGISGYLQAEVGGCRLKMCSPHGFPK